MKIKIALLKAFIKIIIMLELEWKIIRITKKNPWKYIFYLESTQSDKIMTKNVDDAKKNSLKISKLLSSLLSNGFVLPIYNEYT